MSKSREKEEEEEEEQDSTMVSEFAKRVIQI